MPRMMSRGAGISVSAVGRAHCHAVPKRQNPIVNCVSAPPFSRKQGLSHTESVRLLHHFPFSRAARVGEGSRRPDEGSFVQRTLTSTSIHAETKSLTRPLAFAKPKLRFDRARLLRFG